MYQDAISKLKTDDSGTELYGYWLGKACAVKEIESLISNETTKKRTAIKCEHNGKKDRLELPNWFYCHSCEAPFKRF